MEVLLLAEILEPTEKNIFKAAEIIRQDGLVAFPTETVYGLGGCAFSKRAVVKIFEAKKRPRFDPLIVHIAEKEDFNLLCIAISSTAKKLIDAFCPGPLTLVLPKKENVPDIVTSGLDTVAVRIPSNPVALQLIKYSRCPIAAPSANRFGHVSPTRAEDVLSDLGDSVDIILDGGPTLVGVESTVVFVQENKTILLRPGGIPIEDIERIVGKVTTKTKTQELLSPGLTKKHYSPKTPLYIYEGSFDKLIESDRDNYALLTPTSILENDDKIFPLSRDGDLKEIAANLFHQLRKLELMDFRAIIAIPVERSGLGYAIMDRLIRASTGTVKVENQKLVCIDR